MADKMDGCVKPARGPIEQDTAPAADAPPAAKEARMTARVGREAPDFETNGHFRDEFKTYRLSEYKGKWIVLCFYPGDFTFV